MAPPQHINKKIVAAITMGWKSLSCLSTYTIAYLFIVCHKTQHNDIQHNDTRHNDIHNNNTQHNDIQQGDIQNNSTEHDDMKHSDIQRNNTQNNMLSVANNPILLSVIMQIVVTLNVVALFIGCIKLECFIIRTIKDKNDDQL